MAKSERLSYIDIAKGILIMLVVFHHIPHIVKNAGMYDPFCLLLDSKRYIYTTFFMPAFFLVTGFCSNFDVPFFKFLKKNVKTILIPAFCLGAIAEWIRLIGLGETQLIAYCKLGFSTFIKFGGPYWFLSSLFLSKIIYWIENRFVKSTKIKFTISLLLLIIGICISNRYSFVEYWYILHALVFPLFLLVGQIEKNKQFHSNKYVFGCSLLIYGILIFLLKEHPSITAVIAVSDAYIPCFIILSVCGSFILLYICKKISSCGFLERLGKDSLVIYTLHIAIARIMVNILSGCFCVSMMKSFLTFLFIYSATLLILMLVAKCMNTKYLQFLIGKF